MSFCCSCHAMLDQCSAADADLKRQQDEFKAHCDSLEAKIKNPATGQVAKGQAVQQLAALKGADPLPLRKAKITQEAAVRKVEAERKVAEGKRKVAEAERVKASGVRAKAEAERETAQQARQKAEVSLSSAIACPLLSSNAGSSVCRRSVRPPCLLVSKPRLSAPRPKANVRRPWRSARLPWLRVRRSVACCCLCAHNQLLQNRPRRSAPPPWLPVKRPRLSALRPSRRVRR